MTDRLVVRMVVVILGLVAILSLALCGLLAWAERGVPDVFVATGSASLGAIGSLLVRTSSEPPPG